MSENAKNNRTLVSKEIFGEVIAELAGSNENIVVCDTDLMRCFGTKKFSGEFPDRHINFGIAEQNCMAASAGAVTTIGTKPPTRALVDELLEQVVIEQISAN